MNITAKVVEKSISSDGKIITTMQLRYPRFIHSEFMTHRLFSRNASSSRAIPVSKMINQVINDPATPVHWGANQAGMQAHSEINNTAEAKAAWLAAAVSAAKHAEVLNALGLHKQVVNRILEPFQFISVIVTATEWENFYSLRDHEDAQPEIQALAKAMKNANDLVPAVPRSVLSEPHRAETWHLPYVSQIEREKFADDAETLCQISAARCARVSYLTHDGKAPNLNDDIALFERLVGGTPLHASPIEHQARPANSPLDLSRNFRGWIQFREIFENRQIRGNVV
jgi:thymidylate synthase ThyX